ncbi:MAG: 2'-deoxycytidine 5'-triphosphate deaminase, partial [Actinobacteria bacterium]|nr:2'-deoxycytidine 5'-triphosphate deaminase [Actinomycetota bacterium]
PESTEGLRGVVPRQHLVNAVEKGQVYTEEPYHVPPNRIQPASIDLRLGEHAWLLRCSFLPDANSTVKDRIAELAFDQISIAHGATLDRNRPYLIPLLEKLDLPPDVRGKANPKSSTGRLDVFTRLITDGGDRFDEVRPGYRGDLYLEVVPRSFAVKVQRHMSLNQLRLTVGEARVLDAELREVHTRTPLLYSGEDVIPVAGLPVSDGLFLSVDLSGPRDRIVGFRARHNSLRLDMSQEHHYWWRDFWEPVYPERGGRIVLDPEMFYLLLSAEGVRIPPDYAAEMMAYDPTAGELRTHYAGFFDPGFGWGSPGGSKAALEVRAHDVGFMLEHGQAICKLAYERMLSPPDRLYGEEIGSHYQAQATMLSKHFTHDFAPNGAPLPGGLFDAP